MGDLDASVIKRTQQTLGKYVKKPALTEKLLTKPPFRFLHDVFNAVIKETGCFVGLYTPEELNSDNIKDRDGKMGFLQKMIDVIKITSNQPLTVRTSKIVAGQEPDKTNELLQLMGEVVEKNLDWRSAVEQVLNGKGPEKEKSTTKSKPQGKPADKNNKDKINEKSKDKENRTKEAKSKDIKKIGKTISPPVKSDKPLKRSTEAREKGNVGRTSKIQITKGSKESNEITVEKSAEKIRASKDKAVVKEKSPPPLKKEASEVMETANKVPVNNANLLEDEGTNSDKTNENVLFGNTRRDSKNLEHAVLSSPYPTALPDDVSLGGVKEITPTISDTGSRKLSAKRKKSSGSKRRSSATTAQQDERKAPIPELGDNIKNEDDNKNETILRKVTSSKLRNIELKQEDEQKHSDKYIPRTTPSPIQSPPPPPPTAIPTTAAQPQPPHEVRRESTFTRENSRDSNNSNNVANRPRTSLRPPSARPASARPGAPRRRDRNIEIVLQPNDQVKLSGINVKLESFGDLDDDGENLVVIEDANSPNIDESAEAAKSVNESDIENNLEQQGHLVQQILETQKELMQQQNVNNVGKTDKDVDLANSSTGRQSSARQMNNLRDIIQNLTKSVNPFGKLMDFIPEDIDAMQLELTMWRDTYTQVANELRREKSLTESATVPMKNQLLQMEASIQEFMDMIDASRTKILQNSQKIIKMLAEQ